MAPAHERVQCSAAGQVVPRLMPPWRDDNMQLAMSPLELTQRLEARVPRQPSAIRQAQNDRLHCADQSKEVNVRRGSLAGIQPPSANHGNRCGAVIHHATATASKWPMAALPQRLCRLT
jgi:hypothetical protein